MLVFCLFFFSLSCGKDDSVEPIDPTEAVELTIRFSFQYLSSDISLKKISASIKLEEQSPNVIESVFSNVSGQPGEYELVLSIRGQSAKDLIEQSSGFLQTEVEYEANGKTIDMAKDKEISIYGGDQSRSVEYELAPVQSVEIKINSHFTYSFNIYLYQHHIGLHVPDGGPTIDRVEYNKIYDDPEKITTTFILEGQEALDHINKERLIFFSTVFVSGGGSFTSYTDSYFHTIEEGFQELDFYFEH